MKVEKMGLGPLGTNCYVLIAQQEAIVIDPGGEGEHLIQWLQEREVKPTAILLTHAHFDHIGAVDQVRDAYKIPVYLHKKEKDWLQNPDRNGSSLFLEEAVTAREADYYLSAEHMHIGCFQFEVIETPGHSPGSVSFIFHKEAQVIAGDALFRSAIGRTDLPEGNMDQLQRSIKEKLFLLEDHFTVLPGHGPATTIGFEKENNPFLRAL